MVAAVLVALPDVAFLRKVPSQNLDLLAYFFPNHCFLGRSLASGHVPGWNPFAMGGVPFASDPQSGWMYLPAMVLYSVAPCDLALPMFLVLQPILGGLAIYWFLRSESVSRPAAASGALVLAIGLAGSRLLTSPFAGTLAWTAVALAAASRLVRATSTVGRVGWAMAVAGGWGQVAAAHAGHGLVVGTGALVAYLAAALYREWRDGGLRGRQVLGVAALVALAAVAVNLAFLVPRLAALGETAIRLGYREREVLQSSLAGLPLPPFEVRRASAVGWPLRFASPLGVYLGAAGLALSFAALWSRRLRPVAVSLGLYAALGYVLSLAWLAEKLVPRAESVRLLDFWLHAPSRLGHGLVLAAAVLVGLGVEAWRSAGGRARVAMLLPALLVWGLLPWATGSQHARPLLLVLGAAAGMGVLLASARRPALLALLPLVLAAELTAAAWAGRSAPQASGVLTAERIDARELVREGAIERTVRSEGGRLMTLGGTEVEQRLHAVARSVPFGIEEAQGYNPAQQLRYWMLVRALNRGERIQHNSAIFRRPYPQALELLQVEWILAPDSWRQERDWIPVTAEDGWRLYRLPDPTPRASLVTGWEVRDRRGTLSAAADPEFDSTARVLLEEDPGLEPGGRSAGSGEATFTWVGNQSAVVEVASPVPAVLVVRNAYDPNWRASIDGREAPVLPADHALQGVPVPAGRHTVRLDYDDPSVGYGLAGSAAASAALLGGAWAVSRRRRPHAGDRGLRGEPPAEARG